MIVMQTKEHRRITGRIGAEGDLLERLRDVCRTHEIRQGDLRGVGYLRSARLSVWDAAEGEFVDEDADGRPAQILSLLGNVSQGDEGPSFHLQVQLLEYDGEQQIIRGGRLLAADVEDFEFFLEVVDDFAFVRAEGEKGLSPWLQIATDAHTAHDDVPSRTEFLPGRLGSRNDDGDDYELKPDDRLLHPRLGRCIVVQVPDEDRASIRLESGRVVELHLGLLKLVRKDRGDSGLQTFQVQIRRRT